MTTVTPQTTLILKDAYLRETHNKFETKKKMRGEISGSFVKGQQTHRCLVSGVDGHGPLSTVLISLVVPVLLAIQSHVQPLPDHNLHFSSFEHSC